MISWSAWITVSLHEWRRSFACVAVLSMWNITMGLKYPSNESGSIAVSALVRNCGVDRSWTTRKQRKLDMVRGGTCVALSTVYGTKTSR